MTSGTYPLPGRLSDVLRVLRQLSHEEIIDWKELKVASDDRAEFVHRTLASKRCPWAGQCDARAVRALLYYLCDQRRLVKAVSDDCWTIESSKSIQPNAWFLEPALVVQCNRFLQALRTAGCGGGGEEMRVVIPGDMHAWFVNLMIDQGEYWAEGYRFDRAGDLNQIVRIYGQLVRRRLIRRERPQAKGPAILMVRCQGQF